jgi:hypothetical protein
MSSRLASYADARWEDGRPGFCSSREVVPPQQPIKVNVDDAPAPRFLVVDPRAPVALRQLLDEADGCLNMSYVNGGTACARRAIDLILVTENASGEDYAECLQKLRDKQPAVAPTLFQILAMLGDGDEPLSTDALRALIATIKAVVFEIYVQGPERVERLMYVHQLVESLKRESGSARRKS